MIYNYGKNKNQVLTNTKQAITTDPIQNHIKTPSISSTGESRAPVYSIPNSNYTPGSGIADAKTGFAQARNNILTNQFALDAQRQAAQQAQRSNAGYGTYGNTVANLDRYRTLESLGRAYSNAMQQVQPVEQTVATPVNASVPSTDTDYAAQILALMQQPQTAETQEKIRQLQILRNWKIEQNPEQYGQYKNDAVDRSAQQTINRILPEENNIQEYISSLYQAQQDLAAQQFAQQAEQVRKQYGDMRNQIMTNAARTARSTEENLAAQGLGLGISNSASSGFGETSRAMANASLNNNLYNAHQSEQSAIDSLQNQYNQNQLQAFMDYANRAAEQENTNRQYNLDIAKTNAQNAQTDLAYGIEKQNADTQRFSAEANAKYQQGTLDNEVARIALDEKLGLEELRIKEKGIDFENDQFYASLNLEEKQYALDKWYKEGLISIQQYEAESGRISANASMLNAQTNAQKKTNSVGSGGSGGASYTPTTYGDGGASYTPTTYGGGSSTGVGSYNPYETVSRYNTAVKSAIRQNPNNPEVARRMIQSWQDNNEISGGVAEALMQANNL